MMPRTSNTVSNDKDIEEQDSGIDFQFIGRTEDEELGLIDQEV